MNCKDIKEYIWLEDEISSKESEELNYHLQSCEKCKEEYNLKKAILNDIKLYDDNLPIQDSTKKQGIWVLYKYTKKTISIAACAIIVMSVSTSVLVLPAFGYDIRESFIGILHSVKENFGRQYADNNGLTMSGDKYLINGIEFDIKSISYDKSDISLFFTLKDTNNINSSCSLDMVRFLVDGEMCSILGNQGVNYINKVSYGDYSIKLPPNTVPQKIELAFDNITIENNAFIEDAKKEIETLKGPWTIKIPLDSKFFDEAGNYYAKYKLDYTINTDDFSANFKSLTLESSKTNIEHEIYGQKNASSQIIGFNDIKIFSKEGGCLSQISFENGKYIYSDQNGLYKTIIYRSDFPFATTLLPIPNRIPSKIEIGSYITIEEIEKINLYLNNIDNVENVLIETHKLDNGKYKLTLKYLTPRSDITDARLTLNGTNIEPKSSYEEFSEGVFSSNPQTKKGQNIFSRTYELNSLNESYELKLWGYRINQVNIEIPIR